MTQKPFFSYGLRNIILLMIFILAIIILVVAKSEISNSNDYCISKMIDKNLDNKGSKTVLLIHGYPEPIYPDSSLYSYFTDRGYNIIAPYLFTPEFKLTKDGVRKFIEEKISEKKSPEIIVGVSMGGLIAPQIAADYHQSKLVMIATGPYVRTNTPVLNTVLRSGKPSFLSSLFEAGKLIPTWLYSIVYKTFNHPRLSKEEKLRLENHIRENWSCVTSIPVNEDIEVVSYLATTDNSQLLKSLNNKTLIFAGDGDIMMPTILSTKLNELIKNSKLIVSKNRLHYSVFNEENFKDLDEFLSD